MTEGQLDTSPDTIQHSIAMEIQFDPNTGKWYRKVHEILGGKSALLTFVAGTSSTIYTLLSGQVYEMQSIVINNRETTDVKVELFDATSGDPAAGTNVFIVTVPAGASLPLFGMKGYMFATGIRGRVTTATSTGVDISIGGQLAIKT